MSKMNENNTTRLTKFLKHEGEIVYHLKTVSITKRERDREREAGLNAVSETGRIHPSNSSPHRLQQAPRHQRAVRHGGRTHPKATP